MKRGKNFARGHMKKAPILGSFFKTEHIEAHGFSTREILPNVFYYELYKDLIKKDICVSRPTKTRTFGQFWRG